MKTTEQLKDEKLRAVTQAAKDHLLRDSGATRDALYEALAMPTEEKPRYYNHQDYSTHRVLANGDVEYWNAGEWQESGLHDHQITEENGWTEYFPYAEEDTPRIGGFTVKETLDAARAIQRKNEDGPQKIDPSDNPFRGLVLDINKPYLPLPAPDLVLLGKGGEFETLPNKERFDGWTQYIGGTGKWNKGEWIGAASGNLYAAPRDSEIARLNWEKILNREPVEALPTKTTFSSVDEMLVYMHGEDSEIVRNFRALVESKPPTPCSSVPTERQKMAKDFAVAFIHSKVKGIEFSTTQSVVNECFMLADLILGRKDGE